MSTACALRGGDWIRPRAWATTEAVRHFRYGLVDICAAGVVLVAIFLPERGATVTSAYPRQVEELPERRARVAALQGQVAAHPEDGEAVEELSRALLDLGQHDLALRVAGAAAEVPSPERWRALLALSSVHAERIEIEEAHEHAVAALEACRADGADCPEHLEVRLRLYAEELDAGVAAIAAGADPRLDPDGFRREMARVHPTARFRPGRSTGGDSERDE